MNFNVFAYRTARNQLHASREIVDRLGQRQVCLLSQGEAQLYDAAEQRAINIPTFIDRLRFLSKHDRSRYEPHIGARQRSKNDNRKVCCLPEVTQ